MARRSSSSMEVLLGLLTIEPMSGYDLGLTIRASVGHFWNESYGQIYPNLRKLATNGFVSCKTERQKGKPDRRIYSITKKGRKRLTEWLAVPPQPEIPRNELLLKLFFGEQDPGAPYWRMAAHYGQIEMKAHLRWAEETLAELDKIATKQRSHSETGPE